MNLSPLLRLLAAQLVDEYLLEQAAEVAPSAPPAQNPPHAGRATVSTRDLQPAAHAD